MATSRNLTLRELALDLGYNQRTITQLISEGKGPGIKIRGRYLIRSEWVERRKAGDVGFWAVAIAGLRAVNEVPEPEPIYVRRV